MTNLLKERRHNNLFCIIFYFEVKDICEGINGNIAKVPYIVSLSTSKLQMASHDVHEGKQISFALRFCFRREGYL
jgi:hypothetical protein